MKSPKSIYQIKYEYALNRYTEQKHQQKGGSRGITKLTTFYKKMEFEYDSDGNGAY